MRRPSRISRCRAWAQFYSDMGWNPLPSRTDSKRPALRTFARWLREPIPQAMLDHWSTANVQVVTGIGFGLCAIDLDEAEGIARWDDLCDRYDCPPTWTSSRDPAVSRHLWFRTPPGLEKLSSRYLWRVHGGRAGVQLIGDRSLIVAPPSVHPRTGQTYRWAVGRSPRSMPEPATLPWWVLGLGIAPPRHREPLRLEPLRRPPVAPRVRGGEWYDWKTVLSAIPDKISLALSWGLRVDSNHANEAGWHRCRQIDRTDDHPSAMFSADLGYYCEMGPGGPERRLALFDLAVELGVYPSFYAALSGLARQYSVPPGRERTIIR